MKYIIDLFSLNMPHLILSDSLSINTLYDYCVTVNLEISRELYFHE